MTKLMKRKLLVLVAACAATSVDGANHVVGIGDGDCPLACFQPAALTIRAGDSVSFFYIADTLPTGPHNVVADDGSFRCARGCDGEGGDGTPADWGAGFGFTRRFPTPGRFGYHDEVSRAAGVIIVTEAPNFAIGPGITGAWYDPAHSGHGLLIEVLPGNRLQAAWLAFDPFGAQAWFMGVGSYDGDSATLDDVVQLTGGRWIPDFDPARIELHSWGTLTFTFADCNRGRVDFSARAGFGSGSMELTRLTLPAGISCP
jgi:plastocyanin